MYKFYYVAENAYLRSNRIDKTNIPGRENWLNRCKATGKRFWNLLAEEVLLFQKCFFQYQKFAVLRGF